MRNPILSSQDDTEKSGKTSYDIDESFPMLMATCVNYMRESLNARVCEAGFNVSSEQWMILTYLAYSDGISQQDLADRYQRSKVSTLALLKKLEKNGLITRQPDPDDGRSNLVYLTSEGRNLQQSLIPIAKKNVKRMSEGLSCEDIERFKITLRKITTNLKK